MPFTTAISKEDLYMYKTTEIKIHPFGVMVQKEISDIVRSWKFLIMVSLVVLTCLGSLYGALSDFGAVMKNTNSEPEFFFLKLFTHSDGTIPSFIVFVSFLGPLLGISMGFDGINAEQNRGTLSRVLAQPVYRDYIINAKFMAALCVLSILFTALTLCVLGFGLIFIGIAPSPDEVIRIIAFLAITIVYVAFWLNLSILFSVKFKQAATSALSAISIWLFFTIFYGIIVKLVAKGMAPGRFAGESQYVRFEHFIQNLMRFDPSQLFNDATASLLMPSIRSLGPLTKAQTIGAIPTPLPVGQSLMLIWPQATALLAGTLLFFALAYMLFMRREVRSR